MPTSFPNLAGAPHCDGPILEELLRAGIDPVYHHQELVFTEVPAKYTGELGSGEHRFNRAWYYWVYSGEVPYALAKEIFEEAPKELGIRAGGHGENQHPEKQSNAYERRLMGRACLIEHQDRLAKENKPLDPESAFVQLFTEWIDRPLESSVVKSYHIDTLEGLAFFAGKLRQRFGGNWLTHSQRRYSVYGTGVEGDETTLLTQINAQVGTKYESVNELIQGIHRLKHEAYLAGLPKEAKAH